MTDVVFLGTGNYLAPGRYWNSFVLDGSILVEPSPTVLPNLRRCGLHVDAIEVVVISHFHADHTFGWPFLLLELVHSRRARPLFIVGPPGVETYLAGMMQLGGVANVQKESAALDLRYVEAEGSWQQAGPLRLRSIAVAHVPHLECFGYLLALGPRVIGYSGDTRPCPGLDDLAAGADVLIVECNSAHPPKPPLPVTHMDLESIGALRNRFPDLPFVLTHLGADVDTTDIPGVTVAEDFARMTI